jgi:hypothetical protein
MQVARYDCTAKDAKSANKERTGMHFSCIVRFLNDCNLPDSARAATASLALIHLQSIARQRAVFSLVGAVQSAMRVLDATADFCWLA